MNTSNKLSTALIVACGLLGIAVLIIFLMHRNNKMDEMQALLRNGQAQAEIARLEDVAKRAGGRADSLQVNFGKLHLSDSLSLAALSVRNKAMSETVHKLRIPVQVTIDTMEALGDFVRAYDSLLAGKDQEIGELKLRHSAQVVELNEIIAERVNQMMAQTALAETWRQTADNAEQDQQKETKRKKVWRAVGLVGIGTTGILLLLVK